MPRGRRIKARSKIYHIMSRALDKRLLFEDELDYLDYLKLIQIAKERYHFKIYAYCLMGNHVHLLINDKTNTLSKFMQFINELYARYFNEKYIKIGYVFNNRFLSETVEDENYLRTVIRYIHQNTVKAGYCDSIYKYKFSSIHAYKNSKGNYLDLVDTNGIKKTFGNEEFLKWNEEISEVECLDIKHDKMSDKEANELFNDLVNNLENVSLKNINAKDLPNDKKVHAVKQLLDLGLSYRQISRVSGMYVGKIKMVADGSYVKRVNVVYPTRKKLN